ncbi:MAG: nuclear transport factor 2 family protein [Hydrogenophaga sp.]|jgi:steroid Delta-isomerase|nr:nuclear transport factor 2 family protein [Hydrogenophaga sp.]
MDHRTTVDRIVDFFETLSPERLARLDAVYADDARFKDPFNEVRGVPAIRRVFEHMYVSLHEPRFVVTQRVVDGAQCFLVWEFRFRMRRFDTRTEQVIRGGSHLLLAADGRIAEHRDYWDAAEELYEKLPLIGGLMRWLKARANG